MRGRLWVILFFIQIVVTSLLSLVILGSLIHVMKKVSLAEFIRVTYFGISIHIILIAFILAFAIIFASYFAFKLYEPYDDIRARINWLLLGKYSHPVFKQSPSTGWFQDQSILYEDIEQLRHNLMQMSKDLQEFSAAPIFVGEETKEEIIEGERHRIARELHDSVSQELFAAMMLLSTVNSSHQDLTEAKKQLILQKITNIIEHAQSEMRALLLHLRPIGLEGKTLSAGIIQLLTELETKVPLSIKWELDDVQLDSGIENHLFRIVQEVISNTLRHAKAKHFDVFLKVDASQVQLKIIDDGVGFDLTHKDKLGAYGLYNIKERAKNLGGVCHMISKSGKGTSIEIAIPFTHELTDKKIGEKHDQSFVSR